MIPSQQAQRTKHVFWAVVLCIAVLLLRVYDLQCLRPEDNQKRALRQHKSIRHIPARRGRILDRHGTLLAMTTTRPAIWSDPGMVRDASRVAMQLSSIVDMTPSEIERRITHPTRRFVWIAREASETQAQRVAQLKERGELQGIYVQDQDHRVYPQGMLCGNLLGLVGYDGRGAEGLEFHADRYLRGRDGFFVMGRDSRRRIFYDPSLHTLPPENGYDVYLTIDEYIQRVAEEELQKAVEEFTPESATIIVQQPHTGEILALAQWPSMNPNNREEYRPGIFRNFAASDYFEPGSTMKIISGAIALDTHVVNVRSNIFCENGRWQVTRGHALHDVHPMGYASFMDVIKHSSNIGIAKVARLVEADIFHSYLRRFGFGERTTMPFIPLESPGLLRPVSGWSELSMVSIPIGHEIGVTALQLISAVSTVANGGTRVRPQIVRTIMTAQGDVMPEARRYDYFEPKIQEERVISPETARQMTEMLVRVTEPDGTGRNAHIAGYEVAGKTGTAQKFDREKGAYSRRDYISSFVGYVPAHDPELVVLVVVDSPRGRYYGSQVAAPIFRRITADALVYLQVPPKDTSPLMQAQVL